MFPTQTGVAALKCGLHVVTCFQKKYIGELTLQWRNLVTTTLGDQG